MSLVLYPASPIEKIDPQVSRNFKKNASKVVASIFAFFIVFILLLAATAAFATGAFFAGVAIMTAFPSWITFLLGTGIIIAGCSLVFFVIKFAFTRDIEDDSHLVEINKEEQPRLFDFLKKLTDETGTAFPSEVYLSGDVNAAVYIRPTFMNMFFPARKNLVIGVGLVNVVNLSEFKAIMAHEFGHFSQKSLKIGPFIYNVNRVIFNMLFENTGYVRFIQRWSSVNWILSLFGLLTLKLMEFIQWILRGMYKLINVNYYSLSREMEHNADDIAASVAGGNNLMSGLKKISPASDAYDYAIELAYELSRENKKMKNIYFAQTCNLLNSQYQEKRSRVNFKNQWASHPSHEERKRHLDQLNINLAATEKSAWLIFDDAASVQVSLTDNFYRNMSKDAQSEVIDGADYENWAAEHKRKYGFPDIYKGFYNNRYLLIGRSDIESLKTHVVEMSPEEIFTEENGRLYSTMIDYKNDLNIVNAIASKDIKVKTFDFDGKKYDATDSAEVRERLQLDINILERKIHELESAAFVYYYNKFPDKSHITDLYLHFFNRQDISKKYAVRIEEGTRALYSIQNGITVDEANKVGEKLRLLEIVFLKEAYEEIGHDNIRDDELRKKLADFKSKSYMYFSGDSFMPNEVQEFNNAFFLLAREINLELNAAYRGMVEGQANGN
jgi:Zn-dependent protease with chaperone function